MYVSHHVPSSLGGIFGAAESAGSSLCTRVRANIMVPSLLGDYDMYVGAAMLL